MYESKIKYYVDFYLGNKFRGFQKKKQKNKMVTSEPDHIKCISKKKKKTNLKHNLFALNNSSPTCNTY